MKVLFVLRETPAEASSDGMTRWLYNVTQALSRIAERVDILGQHRAGSGDQAALREHCRRFLSVSSGGRTPPYYKWFLGWDAAKIKSYNPDLARYVKLWSEQTDYDLAILLGHGAHVYLPSVRASHIMVVPLDAPSGLVHAQPRGLILRAKAILDGIMLGCSQRSYNRADSVLVVSEQDRDLLAGSGVKARIVICPIGIDVNEFRPRVSQQDRTLLFTGVLDFTPNIDAVVHLVRDIYSPANLIADGIGCRIAGRRPSQAVRDLCGNGVELLANVPDLRVIFAHSMVYVAPMRIGLGMKTKVLEAMAMGLPIIGYPLAFNGIAHPEEFALICRDTGDMVESIRRLFGDEQLRRELGTKARQYVERYHSAAKVVEIMLRHVACHTK